MAISRVMWLALAMLVVAACNGSDRERVGAFCVDAASDLRFAERLSDLGPDAYGALFRVASSDWLRFCASFLPSDHETSRAVAEYDRLTGMLYESLLAEVLESSLGREITEDHPPVPELLERMAEIAEDVARRI